MRNLIFFIFIFYSNHCLSQNNHRSLIYKNNLSGKTFIQQNIVKMGDTMIFKFGLDDTLTFGYSNLLHQGKPLHPSIVYKVDCNSTICHIDFAFFNYNTDGKPELTGEVNKGLIEFLTSNKFRIRFNSNNQKIRPVNFVPTDHSDIFIFEYAKNF